MPNNYVVSFRDIFGLFLKGSENKATDGIENWSLLTTRLLNWRLLTQEL